MAAIILAASIAMVAVLAWMSIAFSRRVAPGVRLPMQWGFDGRPTWYARRAVALAFTPGLAAVIAVSIGLSAGWTGAPSAGALLGVVGLVGSGFLAAHAAHLYLLSRWLKSQPPA